jgi:hypothetical protein
MQLYEARQNLQRRNRHGYAPPFRDAVSERKASVWNWLPTAFSDLDHCTQDHAIRLDK